MGFKLNRLLPTDLQTHRELNWSVWLLAAVSCINTARSFIHMLAPDGGAMSIAGIPVNVEGGADIIAIFAQWGASQLVLVMIYWVVIVRYRTLCPLVWFSILVEQVLRYTAEHLKPINLEIAPPGAYWTYILMLLSVVVLAFSLWERNDKPITN